MAVAWNNDNGTIPDTSGTPGASFSYTSGSGANRALLVVVFAEQAAGNGSTIGTLTAKYGSQTMTALGSCSVSSSTQQMALFAFGLIAPATGANTVLTTASGWGAGWGAYTLVADFTGVDQGSVATSFANQTAGGPTASQANDSIAITSQTNDLVWAVFGQQGAGFGGGATGSPNASAHVNESTALNANWADGYGAGAATETISQSGSGTTNVYIHCGSDIVAVGQAGTASNFLPDGIKRLTDLALGSKKPYLSLATYSPASQNRLTNLLASSSSTPPDGRKQLTDLIKLSSKFTPPALSIPSPETGLALTTPGAVSLPSGKRLTDRPLNPAPQPDRTWINSLLGATLAPTSVVTSIDMPPGMQLTARQQPVAFKQADVEAGLALATSGGNQLDMPPGINLTDTARTVYAAPQIDRTWLQNLLNNTLTPNPPFTDQPPVFDWPWIPAPTVLVKWDQPQNLLPGLLSPTVATTSIDMPPGGQITARPTTTTPLKVADIKTGLALTASGAGLDMPPGEQLLAIPAQGLAQRFWTAPTNIVLGTLPVVPFIPPIWQVPIAYSSPTYLRWQQPYNLVINTQSLNPFVPPPWPVPTGPQSPAYLRWQQPYNLALGTQGAQSSVPFTPNIWAISIAPAPIKQQQPLNLLSGTLTPEQAHSPFITNTARPPVSVQTITWQTPQTLALNTPSPVVVTATPFVPNLWQVPAQTVRLTGLQSTNLLPLGTGFVNSVDQPPVFDWPTIPGPIVQIRWQQPQNLLPLTSQTVVHLPFMDQPRPFDWPWIPGPQRGALWDQRSVNIALLNNEAITVTRAPVYAPRIEAAQFNRGFVQPVGATLLSQSPRVTITYQITPFDWQLTPAGQPLVKWQQPQNVLPLVTSAGGDSGSLPQRNRFDWPVPRSKFDYVDRFLQRNKPIVLDTQGGDQGSLPSRNFYSWPVPLGANSPYPNSLRTTIASTPNGTPPSDLHFLPFLATLGKLKSF